MPELIKLNGSAVSAVGCHKKELAQPGGPAVEEYHVAVMLRGRMTHRSFAAVLQSPTIRLEVGNNPPRETTVTTASVTSTGGGESAVYRHDFVLRETADSATRRTAATAGPDPKLAELEVFIKDTVAQASEVSPTEDSAAADTWATALQKLTATSVATAPGVAPAPHRSAPPNGHAPAFTNGVSAAGQAHPAQPAAPVEPHPAPSQPASPAPPITQLPPPPASLLASPTLTGQEVSFSPAELAGIEAVLVGLRIETVIDALDKLEILPRSEIEQAFLRLVRERFVAEATLVVGEPVARRAARDILHGLGVGRWSLGDRR